MTATVVILAVTCIAVLLQLRMIQPVLAFPLFLLPLSGYLTAVGIARHREERREQAHSYNFVWAGIMAAAGACWIVLYEGQGPIMGAITVLMVSLGYIYLDRLKSSRANSAA